LIFLAKKQLATIESTPVGSANGSLQALLVYGGGRQIIGETVHYGKTYLWHCLKKTN